MRRFIRFDHLGNVIGEVSENDIMALVRREQINGEHSLEITTVQVLKKNERIVYKDGRGVWREYVIVGIDEEHASGKQPIGTYYCVWSIQNDLMGVIVSVMPGVQQHVLAGVALTSALSSQSRWTVGTVTNTNVSGASMYDMSVWNALCVLIENWKGELSTTIEVANNSGVIARNVDLYSKQGDQTGKRRFDFGDDIKSVKRIIADEPMYCRISPRGKGEETESGGYGRKITIESVNGGRDYLEYLPMVDYCKIPDGNSSYIYPTLIVENGDCETPLQLYAWATNVLDDYCTPKISYEIDATQSAVEGVSVQGVSLGDAVQVVDRYFGEGLRISGRIVEMTVDELNEKEISVVIGSIGEGFSSKFSSLDTVRETVKAMNGGTLSTANYLNRLLDRINGEINASGGYTYITEGEGIRTYNTAVTDPLVGSEASSVVEIKGGSIRIANSRTAQGDWDWRSVFLSGSINADLVTAAKITTGYIGSAGHTYIDLDNHTQRFGDSYWHNVLIDNDGLHLKWGNDDNLFVGYLNSTSTSTYSPSFTFGKRTSNTNYGAYSASFGQFNDCADSYSFASGSHNNSYGQWSHCFGTENKSTNTMAFTFGWDNESSEYLSFSMGEHLKALSRDQLVLGAYNSTVVHSKGGLVIGSGTPSQRKNSLTFDSDSGNLWISGTLTQSSDEKLKRHIKHLGDDVCEFIQKLRPVLFEKDGKNQYGFYAQDVASADPYSTDTVALIDNGGQGNIRTLNYTALIAPLVAYVQSLERRIKNLESKIKELSDGR